MGMRGSSSSDDEIRQFFYQLDGNHGNHDDTTTHNVRGFPNSGMDSQSFDEEVTSNVKVGKDRSLEDCDIDNQKGDDCGTDKEQGDIGVQNDQVIDEVNEIVVPEVNMKFKSIEEMYDFYLKYAYSVGFPVRKRSTKKGKSGQTQYISLCCSREGQRLENQNYSSLRPQPTIQFGCRARITASYDLSGNWRINKVILEHNHETSPSKSRVFLCNRIVDARMKRKLELDDIAGIPTHKSYISSVVEKGGYDNMTCVEKDCRNHVEKARRLRLGEGDAAAIQAYFQKMQKESHGFYFVMDIDEKSRLKNVFWADNRSRQAYKEFGDVVTFDTTYLTNKYDMPFAPFVGVNHHGQSTLLGCGLISNEDTETFVWLFRAWLDCMENQAPNAIITDQDRAMQKAIKIVFPDTRHRWCLWHILKKLPEKFGRNDQKYYIFSTISRVVYDSQTEEEFEEGWRLMLEKYELHEHDWLIVMYMERSRWVPCFLKTMFWAGMSTTQRSESINAFFDGFVDSQTSLKQFVEQYDRALRSKCEKEFQADFRSFSQMVPCASRYAMEKQFREVYTIDKFREFQVEFTGKMYCEVVSTEEGVLEWKYHVREDIIYDEGTKKQVFIISYKKDRCEFECSCHLFEFRGIICRHAITVLIRNDVQFLPDKYILRKWMKDVKRPHTRVAIKYDGWISTPSQLRYEQICQSIGELADMVADDEEQSKMILKWIEHQKKEVSSNKSRLSCGSNGITSSSVKDCQGSTPTIFDPERTVSKGAPRKLRKKGFLEAKQVPSSSNKPRKPRQTKQKGTSSEEVFQKEESVSFSQTSKEGFVPHQPHYYTHQLLNPYHINPQYLAGHVQRSEKNMHQPNVVSSQESGCMTGGWRNLATSSYTIPTHRFGGVIQPPLQGQQVNVFDTPTPTFDLNFDKC